MRIDRSAYKPTVGGDIALDHPPVPVGGRGTDSTLPFRQPRVGQVVAESDRVSATRDRHTVGFGDARRDCFGISLTRSGRMPSSAFSTGDRVDAVVDDDIETVVTGNDVCHLDDRHGRQVRRQPEDQRDYRTSLHSPASFVPRPQPGYGEPPRAVYESDFGRVLGRNEASSIASAYGTSMTRRRWSSRVLSATVIGTTNVADGPIGATMCPQGGDAARPHGARC